jgi:hypothetical protein
MNLHLLCLRLRFERWLALVLCVSGWCLPDATANAAADSARVEIRKELRHAAAPVDNPLKGLVPYAGQGNGFPCSLEFNYLALSELMDGPESFTWAPLERLLNDISGRGRQAVFRVWMEYPRRSGGIPKFLLEAGVRAYTYTNTNTQPLPPALVTTPDYNDPRLRQALVSFIRALGARYDGDPRIGFITAGLLGTWGEWHTYPRNDLWAGKETQAAVLDAYTQSFRRTPVLLRYPAAVDEAAYVATGERPFGYHDDSFAWATRETGRREDGWFFVSRLRAAGPAALTRWQTHPIGGEVRPEVWPCVWETPSCAPEGQGIRECIEDTHVTWLMDTGIFRGAAGRPVTESHRAQAAAAVRRMGYELQVQDVRASFDPSTRRFELSLSLTNHGVAPFYQPWAVEVAWRAPDGRMTTRSVDLDLRRILPGRTLKWDVAETVSGLGPGEHSVLLRVIQPLKGGRLFRFANAEQDAEVPGWLTLLKFPLPAERPAP